jgi:hypothetical protein
MFRAFPSYGSSNAWPVHSRLRHTTSVALAPTLPPLLVNWFSDGFLVRTGITSLPQYCCRIPHLLCALLPNEFHPLFNLVMTGPSPRGGRPAPRRSYPGGSGGVVASRTTRPLLPIALTSALAPIVPPPTSQAPYGARSAGDGLLQFVQIMEVGVGF